MKVKTNVQGLKTPCAKVNELLNFQNYLILYILEGNMQGLLKVNYRGNPNFELVYYQSLLLCSQSGQTTPRSGHTVILYCNVVTSLIFTYMTTEPE